MNSSGQKTISVLLIEDSEAVALQIRQFLQAAGSTFTLKHAQDLKTGIRYIEEAEIDVILLDLGLPDSDGLDTLSRVNQIAPDVATVVFTGVEDDDISLEALRKGAQDYLVKSQVNGKLVTRAIRYAIERKQTEEAIRVSEEKHRHLLEAMPDIVYKIDSDGYFKYINVAVESLGFKVDELLGKHFSTIVHPDDVQRISRTSLLPMFIGQATGYRNAPKMVDERRTGRRMTKDLTVRLVPKGWNKEDETDLVIGSLTSYGEITAAGQYKTDRTTNTTGFSGTVGIIKDITERKRAEEEKAALENQLQQSQKMEAIGRLAGGVAHDMNNVLGAILGSASVLQLEIDADDPKRADVENILVACRKGRDLTQDLLGFARKGKYVKESIYLNDVVEEAKALLSRTIGGNITFKTEYDDDLDPVEGDRSQIHHAVMNVCINAVDAMDGPGELTLKARNIYLDELGAAKVGDIPVGDYVELTVRDTGTGMDPETLQMVFEPFFTTKPKGEGTGLGLSMVYGVVKNHGGIVTIDSEIGVGTTLSFVLPAKTDSPAVQREKSERKPSQSVKRGGILLADDEHLIRSSAKRLLERLGYTVFLADNGLTAIETYREHQSEISLVILDCIMPEMDGPEAFEGLMNMNPAIKILLLSGLSKDEKVERLIKDGAMGFVQKPFDIQTLSKAVERAFS